MIKPTPEQFEEWREHPVTRWVLGTVLTFEMVRTRESFAQAAWDGHGDPVTHAAHRERYETLEWLQGLDMPTIEATLGEQD